MSNTSTTQNIFEAIASELKAELQRRYGLLIPEAVVTGLMESAAMRLDHASVPAAKVEPKVTNSVEAIVRASLETGGTYVFKTNSCRTSIGYGPVLSYGPFVGDFHAQLKALTQTELPCATEFSLVVHLSDGAPVFLKLMVEDSTIWVRALPAQRPALGLEDLGITQVGRWRSALQNGPGLYVVQGKGVHTTFRATADELERMNHKVIWVSGCESASQLLDLNADVYIFERRLTSARAARGAVALAQEGKQVLVATYARSIQDGLRFLEEAVGTEDLSEALSAALFQLMVPRAPVDIALDAAFQGQRVTSPNTLISECAVFEDEWSIPAAMEGKLPMRGIIIDAAEKVRRLEISEESARAIFGEALDIYL